ncbi:MAG: rhomboid family intramembrane serine protease [Nanoarchaeota archaeon]|nr:rhomboid family intramembrane serine protease [Nanoarchaeota archaeon]
MRYVALYILVACVIAFILQSIFPITDSLVLVSSEVLIHPWTLITHMFLHGSFEHLFYNMFALGLFGLILCKMKAITHATNMYSATYLIMNIVLKQIKSL